MHAYVRMCTRTHACIRIRAHTRTRTIGEGYLCDEPALLLDVTLHGDTWASNVSVYNSTLFRTLVGGFAALTPRVVQLGPLLYFGNESLGTNYTVQTYRYTGWDDEIQPALQVEQLSPTVLRFTLPPRPGYDALDDEVVQLRLAPELLTSRNPPQVRPLLRVRPAAAAAFGSLLAYGHGGEYAVQNHSTASRVPLAEPPTLVLILSGDRWSMEVGEAGTNATRLLLEGVVPQQNETTGWLQVVRPALSHEHLTRISDDTVRLVLPRTLGSRLGLGWVGRGLGVRRRR